jgi:hypothetical protein
MALFLSSHMNQHTKAGRVGKLWFCIAQVFKDSATEMPFQPNPYPPFFLDPPRQNLEKGQVRKICFVDSPWFLHRMQMPGLAIPVFGDFSMIKIYQLLITK